jgi:hypothetical protein
MLLSPSVTHAIAFVDSHHTPHLVCRLLPWPAVLRPQVPLQPWRLVQFLVHRLRNRSLLHEHAGMTALAADKLRAASAVKPVVGQKRGVAAAAQSVMHRSHPDHHLDLGATVQCLLAGVASNARGLVAAEGHRGIEDIVTVALPEQHTATASDPHLPSARLTEGLQCGSDPTLSELCAMLTQTVPALRPRESVLITDTSTCTVHDSHACCMTAQCTDRADNPNASCACRSPLAHTPAARPYSFLLARSST